jgi:cell division protein FtsL
MVKIFTLPVMIVFAAAVGAGALLFWTSQNVQQKERQLAALHSDSAREAQEIRVLRTEWDYLNRPERIEALAKQYLGMEREKTGQIVAGPGEIPARIVPVLPPQKPAVRQEAVYHPPAAPAAIPPSARKAAPSSPAPGNPSAKDTSHSFQTLLKSLNDGKEGR